MTNLLRQIDIAGTQFDMGSDFHWGTQGQRGVPSHEAGKRLDERLAKEQRSDYLVVPGDLMHGVDMINYSRGGLDVSRPLNEFFTHVRRRYKKTLFVPGNHCLRRNEKTEDPWATLDPGENVEMPRGNEPIVVSISGTRILLANMFYDGHLFGNEYVNQPLLQEHYALTPDGHSLFMGAESIPHFRTMTQNAAVALRSDIDGFVTHVVPHTSATPTLIPSTDRPRLWQRKLGSNVFEPELGANPRDGLTVISGHTHKSEDHITNINGKQIRFVSHQEHQYCH